MGKYNIRYILGISFVAALGGLLFGYDWVVIGGAKPFYERFFMINNIPNLQGWAMSSALLGCIIGAMSSGVISDRFGRKPSLIIVAIIFTFSAIGTGFSDTLSTFIFFRLIGGLGIGMASSVSPIYISEVSPEEIRGRFVSLNQLAIVIGVLLAQIVNFLIAKEVPENATDEFIANSWNGQMGWRWMFWAETVPASLLLIFAFLIPESPRWLLKSNHSDKAKITLQKIGGESYASEKEIEISETLSSGSHKIDFKTLFSKKITPILVIGMVIAIFQQWCGINVIFYYAEEIFNAAGYGVSDILMNIIITGSISLIFTFVAIQTVDNWGRRKLMLIGASGLTIIYLFMGASYFFNMESIVVLIFVVLAIACYTMTLAPITWVILSEIFPNKVRGAAMSVATSVLWIACFILAYNFPFLNKALQAHGIFWVFAGICIIGFLFILKKLPETKGKSLEEVEKMMIR